MGASDAEFPAGVRGHIQTSWINPFKEQRLVAIGTAGALEFADSATAWEEKLAHYPHGIELSEGVPLLSKAAAQFIDVPRAEPLREECDAFIACVRENRPAPTDGPEGIAVLKVLEAAERAREDG